MPWAIKRTLPSQKRKWAPPAWTLRKPERVSSAPAGVLLLSIAARTGDWLSGSFRALPAVTPEFPQFKQVMPRGEPNRTVPPVAVTRVLFMMDPADQLWSRKTMGSQVLREGPPL